MAQYLTIARPYANAIFQIAKENNKLHEWQQLLQALALCAKDPQVQRLIGTPKLTKQKWVDFFWEAVLSINENVDKNIEQRAKQFLLLLAEGKRLDILPDIAEIYRRLLAEEEKTRELKIFSAKPLDEAQQKLIHLALEQRFSSKISAKFILDESLIGGVLIRSGNWVMDGSIKGKLARLAEQIA